MIDAHAHLTDERFAGDIDEVLARASAVGVIRILALAPQAHRGRRNEPAFVAATYEVVARVRGVARELLAERVRENAASPFGDQW